MYVVLSALLESMRVADLANWSLSRDQVLDLASSLSEFFSHNIKTEIDDGFFGGQLQSGIGQIDSHASQSNFQGFPPPPQSGELLVGLLDLHLLIDSTAVRKFSFY